MKTYPKKRIDIMVEEPVLKRILALLDDLDVSGYTVVAALAGRGKDGAWHRDGLVGRAGSVVQISCILDEARVDEVLTPLFQLVSRQIGIVTISDVQVIRPDQF
jgi:PII-like signaling protein